MSKRLIFLIIISSIVFTLSACSTQPSDQKEDSNINQNTVEQDSTQNNNVVSPSSEESPDFMSNDLELDQTLKTIENLSKFSGIDSLDDSISEYENNKP